MSSDKTKEPRISYKLPYYLEPYREFVNNTGGLSIEELMDRYLNEKNLAFTNVVAFTLGAAVESQVQLLNRLKMEGKLR